MLFIPEQNDPDCGGDPGPGLLGTRPPLQPGLCPAGRPDEAAGAAVRQAVPLQPSQAVALHRRCQAASVQRPLQSTEPAVQLWSAQSGTATVQPGTAAVQHSTAAAAAVQSARLLSGSAGLLPGTVQYSTAIFLNKQNKDNLVQM
jgi:hypothetical protein